MIKRLVLILITIAFFSTLLLGCTASQYKEKHISDVTNGKYSEITKIVSDGRGGKNKPFTLVDKQKINDDL
jgi:hypothetical protein